MIDRQKNTARQQSKSDLLESRRQVLRMGAAGLPMVLTLKASANEILISQLQCIIRLPKKVNILVDENGKAWVGTKNIKSKRNRGLKISDIEKFKEDAQYVFPNGSAPGDYRPDACPPDNCGDDDDDPWGDDDGDDDNGDDDSWDLATTELDQMLRSSLPSQADGMAAFASDDDEDEDDDDGDDDDDEEDCDEEYTDCGYNFYKLRKNQEITPADYLNGSSWNPSGAKGLYVALSITYADSYGNQGSWPGVSCIVSILNYLGQL